MQHRLRQVMGGAAKDFRRCQAKNSSLGEASFRPGVRRFDPCRAKNRFSQPKFPCSLDETSMRDLSEMLVLAEGWA